MGLSECLSIIGAAVSGLSIGVSALAAMFAWKQANAAEEANRISLASLEVSKQQLELEREANGKSPIAEYVPPWMLSRVRGSTFALTNGGTDDEYDVHVEPPAYSAVGATMDFEKIGAKSSVTFLVMLTEASPNRIVTVTWRHRDETDRRSWTGVLPTR